MTVGIIYKRQHFTVILLLAFTSCITVPTLSDSVIRTVEGKVTKIADGDTITVLDSDNEQHRVRIAGIDAPEKRQPFGKASKKRLRELVAGKGVRVEFEKYDHYGRIVGKVLVTPIDCSNCDKTLDAGLSQITSGIAWWYRKYAHEQSPEDQGGTSSQSRKQKGRKSGCGRIRIRSRRGSSGLYSVDNNYLEV